MCLEASDELLVPFETGHDDCSSRVDVAVDDLRFCCRFAAEMIILVAVEMAMTKDLKVSPK